MSNLYRVFHRGLSGTRKLYPADDSFIDNAISIIDKNKDADYYESIYLYDQSHFEILTKTKTLAGIEGLTTDRVVFDFDSKADINQALSNTRDLVQHLVDGTSVPDNAIRIFYSGSKGFHVEIHMNQKINRIQFEKIVEYYAGELPSFDHKIKDDQRLFRFPLTRHSKTKRYKIPLSIDQLHTLRMDDIEKLSLNPVHDNFHDILNSYEIIDIPAEFWEVANRVTPVEKKELVTTTLSDRPDMSRKPKHLTPAKFALQEGFFQDGERNEACMILAAAYKYLGYNERHTYNLIKGTLALRAERLGHQGYDKHELYNTIIKPVYSPLWKGGTFSEDDGLLKLTTERYNLDKLSMTEIGLINLPSLSSHFKHFATNIESNTIKLGIDEIDRKVRVTTGMLVAFLAAPGAGKSSVAFGILNTLSNNNESGIFFSMDMGADQVFQRLIQRHTGHQADTILKNYVSNITGEIAHYEEALAENYKNIKFCFKTSLTPDMIRQTVVNEFQMTGKYPKMILLDYLECIQTGINDPTQSKAVAALALKDIANEFGINVFLLTQPTKLVGGPAGELNSYTQIKGSGVVGEQATVVLTMSRPGFDPKHPDDDNYVTVNVVKNRMGPLSSTDLHWNGLTGVVRSLSHEEENDLKALREEIAKQKANKSDEIGY